MAPFDPDKEVIENPTWEEHIRHFFRPVDIREMMFFCNLGDYEDVRKYKSKIYERLITPTKERGMPADGPWSSYRIQTFYNWATNGAPKNSSELA